MTIKEALESKKWFKRPNWGYWFKQFGTTNFLCKQMAVVGSSPMYDIGDIMGVYDLVATDFETKE